MTLVEYWVLLVFINLILGLVAKEESSVLAESLVFPPIISLVIYTVLMTLVGYPIKII